MTEWKKAAHATDRRAYELRRRPDGNFDVRHVEADIITENVSASYVFAEFERAVVDAMPIPPGPPPKPVPEPPAVNADGTVTIPDTEKTLGAAVRWARNARRLTTNQLAKKTGATATFVNNVEHDRQHLKGEQLLRFAAALDIPPVALQVRVGVTVELVDWLREHPELVDLLHEIRCPGRPRGGCPWCGR